jgi:putative methionine-R-sulfoxide reductase with GAF domain
MIGKMNTNNTFKNTYQPVEGEMPESMIYMPLLSKGKTIGVITVQSFEKHIYNEHHLRFIKKFIGLCWWRYRKC